MVQFCQWKILENQVNVHWRKCNKIVPFFLNVDTSYGRHITSCNCILVIIIGQRNLFLQTDSDEFYNAFNGKLFNSLENAVCYLVYVSKVECMKAEEVSIVFVYKCGQIKATWLIHHTRGKEWDRDQHPTRIMEILRSDFMLKVVAALGCSQFPLCALRTVLAISHWICTGPVAGIKIVTVSLWKFTPKFKWS